mmetsp:Transcript_28226/g.81346  ORF Transcript_28226/g.81346 Transcript_28226/m.81346 type:complete len:85 (+) Transcript_28226:2-256(+)
MDGWMDGCVDGCVDACVDRTNETWITTFIHAPSVIPSHAQVTGRHHISRGHADRSARRNTQASRQTIHQPIRVSMDAAIKRYMK